MKYLLVILAVAALTHTTHAQWTKRNSTLMTEIHEHCVEKHNITIELIEDMMDFEYPDEEPMRRYLVCAAEQIGLYSEQDGFYPDRIAQQFKLDMEVEDVLGIAKACIQKKETDINTEVWTYRAFICMVNSMVGERVKYFVRKRLEELQQLNNQN